MGFLLGWLIVMMDDGYVGDVKEITFFARTMGILLAFLSYLLSIAIRLRFKVSISVYSEGWFILGALMWGALIYASFILCLRKD